MNIYLTWKGAQFSTEETRVVHKWEAITSIYTYIHLYIQERCTNSLEKYFSTENFNPRTKVVRG